MIYSDTVLKISFDWTIFRPLQANAMHGSHGFSYDTMRRAEAAYNSSAAAAAAAARHPHNVHPLVADGQTDSIVLQHQLAASSSSSSIEQQVFISETKVFLSQEKKEEL